MTTAGMIYGTDAVSTPDAVSLPEPTERWFTQGNGVSVQGTQVPSYWVNKVGGEISSLIAALGGTLSMTQRNQIASLLEGESAFGLPGYVQFPFGLILQWGTASLNNSTNLVTVALPIPFPNAMLFGVMSDRAGYAYQYGISIGADLGHVSCFCPTQQIEMGAIVTRSLTATGSFLVGGW